MPVVRTAVVTLVAVLATTRAEADVDVTETAVATAAANESPSRIHASIGADVYLVDGDPSLGAGQMSITAGDGIGADLELKLSTIVLASTFEIGPRVYLGDGGFKPYLHADAGLLFIFAIPAAAIITAGVGVDLGHLELDASYVMIGGDSNDSTARLSAGLRF